MISKTFTASTDSLGYFAVIDASIPDGNTDEVTKVTLNKTTASLKKGDKLSLSATVLPKTAADKSVTWESSDKVVATVDTKGVVSAGFGRKRKNHGNRSKRRQCLLPCDRYGCRFGQTRKR